MVLPPVVGGSGPLELAWGGRNCDKCGKPFVPWKAQVGPRPQSGAVGGSNTAEWPKLGQQSAQNHKWGDPVKAQEDPVYLAQAEVAFAKSFYPPGHPRLVSAQDALRQAQAAAFTQKPLDQQARSL